MEASRDSVTVMIVSDDGHHGNERSVLDFLTQQGMNPIRFDHSSGCLPEGLTHAVFVCDKRSWSAHLHRGLGKTLRLCNEAIRLVPFFPSDSLDILEAELASDALELV